MDDKVENFKEEVIKEIRNSVLIKEGQINKLYAEVNELNRMKDFIINIELEEI